MNIKRLISLILSISLLLPTIPMLATAAPKTSLEVGDIIFVGSFGGSPVEYKVMGTKDVDSDGRGEFYLASTKIVSFKAFHAYGGNEGVSWRQFRNTSDTTNLRQWLNSESESISYPSSPHNPRYNAQSGFLAPSNMKAYELENIVTVKNESIKATNGNDAPAKGTTAPVFTNAEWPAPYTAQNYSTVYIEVSEDRVFVPSIAELYEFFGTTKAALAANMNVSVTAAAEAEYATNAGDNLLAYNKNNYTQWTRDNIGHSTGTTKYMTIYSNGGLGQTDINKAKGVRPCMYLDDDTVIESMPGNPGKYRIQPDVALEPEVTQNAEAVADTISSGEINIGGYFSVKNDDSKLVAALYHVSDGKETMEDYAVSSEGSIDLTLTSLGNGDRYVKIYAEKSDGSMATAPVIKGCSPLNPFVSTEGSSESLVVNEPTPNGNSVNITGVVAQDAPDLTLVIESRDNPGVIAYSNRFVADSNKGFDITIDAEYLFGNESLSEIAGYYIIRVISGETVKTFPFAIAGPAVWASVLNKINTIVSSDANYDTKLAELVNIFGNDPNYDLEHNSITDKGFYLDLPSDDAAIESAIEAMIAARPAEGYSDGNVSPAYNEKIVPEAFNNADTNGKYLIIEHGVYKSVLGSAEIIADSNYAALKSSADKAKLFTGATASNFAQKGYENLITATLNSKEDYNDVKSLIENYAAKIGITFGNDYASLSQSETKTLYDAFITGTIASYDEIRTIYTTTLSKIIRSRNAGANTIGSSSGSPSAGSVGGSAGVPVVGGSANNAPEADIVQFKSFPDTENLTWGKEAIEYLAKEGIISGDDKGNFNPDNDITREQFAKIAALAFDIEEYVGANFGDVDLNAWYAPFVSALAKSGAMQGTPDGNFGIGMSITRQDVAVVIARLLGKGNESYNGEKFEDYELIADYARDSVMILSDMGILNGKDGNMFDPLSPITRREAAMIIFRLIGGAK